MALILMLLSTAINDENFGVQHISKRGVVSPSLNNDVIEVPVFIDFVRFTYLTCTYSFLVVKALGLFRKSVICNFLFS